MFDSKTTSLGASAALSAALALTTTSDADAAFSARAHAVGNFELAVDGFPAAFVSSLDGGTMVGEVVSESALRGGFTKKHVTNVKFDPLVFTAPPSKGWSDWGNAAFAGTDRARNGTLSVLDFNFKEVAVRTYTNLHLTGFEIPALNASDKKAFELKLTAIGDRADDGKGSGAMGKTVAAAKGPKLTAGSFRIVLPGVDTSRVVSVSEIAAKATGPASNPGIGRTNETQPSRFDVSNFSVIVGESPSDTTWRSWYQGFIVGGKRTDADEKTLTIELLGPDMKAVLFRVKLEGVGILNLSPTQTEARTEAPRQLQADLYAESIRFEDGSGK